MSPQEEINRQFVAAISALEVTTEGIKEEVSTMKENIGKLVEQMFQIKLMFGGLIIGVIANANPNQWLSFFTHIVH